MQLQAMIPRRQHRTPQERMEWQQRHGKEKHVQAAVHAGVPSAPHGENAQATPQVTDATGHAAIQLLHGKARGKKRKARWENNQWYDNVRGKKRNARWENSQWYDNVWWCPVVCQYCSKPCHTADECHTLLGLIGKITLQSNAAAKGWKKR